MQKREFISQVVAKCGLSTANVSAMLDATHEIAVEQLVETGEVRIPGLATLKVLTRKSRVARNPKTGGQCEVAAGHTVKSRPVAALSARVKDQL